jgi:hypothetical protein
MSCNDRIPPIFGNASKSGFLHKLLSRVPKLWVGMPTVCIIHIKAILTCFFKTTAKYFGSLRVCPWINPIRL